MGEDVEELKGVFSVLSSQVPALIRGIIASVFSEEAGREMGKAAGAFYKGLIEAGIPHDAAIKMTENYISVFTNLGEIMKRLGPGMEKEKKIQKEAEEKEVEKEAGERTEQQ
ncbi:hypothetical protein KEJ34_06885 [Candidatus Bathyarchaeota archaeon]|nr:hypothetical protein [Candidatus Bathyarchaeota archaeon]